MPQINKEKEKPKDHTMRPTGLRNSVRKDFGHKVEIP